MRFEALVIVALLVFSCVSSPRVSAQGINQSKENIDAGWETIASNHTEYNHTFSESFGSEDAYVYINMSVAYYHNLSLRYGFSIPLEINVEYPKEVGPGENVTVNITIEKSGTACFFTYFTGYQYFFLSLEAGIVYGDSTYGVNLTVILENEYLTNIELEIPDIFGLAFIHEDNYMAHLASTNMTFMIRAIIGSEEHNATFRIGFDSYMSFDVFALLNTSIVGLAKVYGSAVEQEQTFNLGWRRPERKPINFKIKDNATSSDTVNIDFNLSYMLHEAYGLLGNISFDADVDSVELRIDGEDFLNDSLGAEIAEIVADLVLDYFISKINELLSGLFIPIFIPRSTHWLKTRAMNNNQELRTEPPNSAYNVAVYIDIKIVAEWNKALVYSLIAILAIAIIVIVAIKKRRK